MLTNIDGEWQYSQHSLKFRRRFLNWPIFVSRWRMTCERSEFATNAYKYSARFANFERMSNLFIRKHIRKHIRLCVRAALVKKNSIAPIVFFNRFILCSSPQQTLQKCFFLIILIPHGLSAIRLFSCRVYRIKWSTCEFCEIQWPRPPLFSPSLLIQWSMGEGSYITLFSPMTSLRFTEWSMGEGGII